VSIPNEMDEHALNAALSEAERKTDSVSEFIYYLKRAGISLVGDYDESMDSPDESEVECTEYDFEE